MTDFTLGKLPPQDLEAEQATLGSMMQDPKAIDRVLGKGLESSDFYREAHATLFAHITRLQEAGIEVDLITLQASLADSAQLQMVGGLGYLATILDSVPHAANAERYCAIVKDKAIRRRLIAVANEAQQMAYDESQATADVIAESAARVEGIKAQFQWAEGSSFSRIADAVQAEMDDLEKRQVSGKAVTGLETSLCGLDLITTGMHPGNYILVAGQPGRGKTAFVLQMLCHLAFQHDMPVGFFSLEMHPGELAQRVLTHVAGVDGHALRIANLNEEDWRKVIQVGARAKEVPLYLSCGNPDIDSLYRMAVKAKGQYGLKLIAVDYVQMLEAPGTDGDTARVARASRVLKGLAMEIGVPMVVTSQLHRPGLGKGNFRPELTDLKNTSQLEQDADWVIFIYHPNWAEKREDRQAVAHDQQEVEFILAKQRNGPICDFRYGWRAWEQRFVEVAREVTPWQ
ncbi:MAG: replicative DNA helicase [bacterium]